MSDDSFPCIICKKPLKRAFNDESQPSGGVMCRTNGNYGSTVYDPGSSWREALVFNICDECIVTAGRQGLLRKSVRIPRPDTFEYSEWPDWEEEN